VATRRELARASFLNTCLPFFDHDERVTAERLAGILTIPMAKIGRAGWNLRLRPDDSPSAMLNQVTSFIEHVERQARDNGIPLD
jgi:hypothetical protein